MNAQELARHLSPKNYVHNTRGSDKCIAVNAAHGNPVQRLVIENEDGLVIDEYAVPAAR